MSVRCSIFYGEAEKDGPHWHAWYNGMRSRPGVFVGVNQEANDEGDEWGYPDLDLSPWPGSPPTGADLNLFLPFAVCEAIAKWVAEQKREAKP